MAYTYLIGWTEHDIWYYGVRYKQGCDPSDLFVSYFTSSNYVHAFIRVYGLPDVVQIRKLFDEPKKALLWEQKVLRRLNAHKNERWLNKNVSGSIYYDDEIREKMRQMKLNRTWIHKDGKKHLVLNELVEEYLKQGYELGSGQDTSGDNNPMWGKKHSEETKKKIGKANSRCTLTDNGKERKSEFMKNNNPMNNKESKKKYLKSMIKVREKTRKKVSDGNKIYNSLSEAAKETGYHISTLSDRCHNNKKGWYFI